MRESPLIRPLACTASTGYHAAMLPDTQGPREGATPAAGDVVTTGISASLLELIRGGSTLCLNARNPGWENARGYLFDASPPTLYFPVAKKFVDRRDLERYEVLTWDTAQRMVITGRLLPAHSEEDGSAQARLALAQGMDPAKVDFMLFDQRTHKPRRTRYKLIVSDGWPSA
jgi:hypothetical protein